MCLIFCEQVDDSSASLSLAQLTQVYVYILVLKEKKKRHLLCIFKSYAVIYSWIPVVM